MTSSPFVTCRVVDPVPGVSVRGEVSECETSPFRQASTQRPSRQVTVPPSSARHPSVLVAARADWAQL